MFIFYRHKVKITLFILGGLLAAAGVFYLLPSPFESQAKLLVRYVVERSTVDTVVNEKGEQQPVQPVGAPSEAILNSEVEILTSSDLALQVAETIGPRRILSEAKGKVTIEEAAIAIRKALEVKAITGSNIISVTYQSKDAKLAVEILNLLVQRYLEKHLEVHRSAGTFNYVSKEAERMGVELSKTEDQLKNLKEKYGVTTIAETITLNGAELVKTQADLDTAQSDLATQKVRLAEIDKYYHGQNMAKEAESLTPPDNAVIDRYANLLSKVESLRKAQADLLLRYTPQSKQVKGKQVELDELEKQKQTLEKKYPALITTAITASGGLSGAAATGTTDIIIERARLAGLESHVTELGHRMVSLQQRATDLNDISPKIAELERTRDVQETSYRYYQSSLEKARIDEGLDPSRMPNISVVQNPSPAVRAVRDLKKVVIGLAVGSVVGGLALALFIELVLDRTIKRSRDLEGRLQLPLLMTIPALVGRNGAALRLTNSNGEHAEATDAESEVEVDRTGQLLRPFCESIRDRLGFYFEMNRMAHKPKLVAVTGLARAAGVSSLAAGLADVFSEAGENKVILVDKPVPPKRFYSMMNEFKTSNLDYVIFDMPSLGDTASTLPMAGFMDKVLLVVEAEKSGREAVKRAYAQLSAKTDVSVIFNKSRSYGPKWLEGEL
jgi:uncharacterized protein involved in exopolysaccharide biosynthesis